MTQEKTPLIEVEDLVVRYGDRTVLNGINFTINQGEIFVIVGGSGSGKTTLLRNLVGLMRPASGHIKIRGEDFTAMTDDEQIELRKKMGMCFQNSALLGSLTVGDNVALPLREHTDLPESTIEIMTTIKLELVDLAGTEDYLPSELSGGMRKRAGVARAIAMDPELIFYDEPSAGLDPIVAAGLDELIRTLQSTFQLTSVVVTHEMESVKLIADRICVLYKGKVAGIGTLKELYQLDHPYIQQFLARRPESSSDTDQDYARAIAGPE